MEDNSAERRPQDRLYESAMSCEKSDTGKHHFVLRYRKDRQRLECDHCGTPYDHTLHSPPEGYQPGTPET